MTCLHLFRAIVAKYHILCTFKKQECIALLCRLRNLKSINFVTSSPIKISGSKSVQKKVQNGTTLTVS